MDLRPPFRHHAKLGLARLSACDRLQTRDGQGYRREVDIVANERPEAFIAEFHRLVSKCTRAAVEPVREAFELLFGLLGRIDEDPDSVIFFADEAGSWQVGVGWRTVLSAYFRCLAEFAAAEDFAREVDRSISDFSNYDRARHLAAARRVASAQQKPALRRLLTGERRR